MKLKNNSSRPHWIGDTLIAPLATETVGDEWRNAYNKQDLEEVTERKDEVIVEAGEVTERKDEVIVEAGEVTERKDEVIVEDEEVTERKDEVIVEAGEVEVKPRGRKVKAESEVEAAVE